MQLKDTLSLSYKNIRSNKLRTGITVAIIAFGIMALIGIITAITAMNQSLSESFSTMGTNSFSIRFRESSVRMGSREVKKTSKGALKKKQSNAKKPITYQEAKLFKERYTFPGKVGIVIGVGQVVVSNEKTKTNPNISFIGADENYISQGGYTLAGGRNFNLRDVQSGSNICILGHSVAKSLFGENVLQALDKTIKVAGNNYRVIGVLQDKGSSAFLSSDNIVVTTYNTIRRFFPTDGISFGISVSVDDMKDMPQAIAEAISTLRPIRKLEITEDNNFYISKSDSIAEIFINSLGTITTAAAFIGLITLFGAAIGLMNIMLVSASERTREIGLIKAIGGTASSIKQQFLFESILISLIGAAFGIVLGILVGNVVGFFMNTGFVVPWTWVIIGIVVCTAVGLFAGLYPAVKASKFDPIVALRYE